MKHFAYLIVGGGMAAAAAIEGIREVDDAGEIGVLAAESCLPYDRPPLSKGLWTDDVNLAEIFHEVEDASNVTLFQDCFVEKVDPSNQRVTDSQGNVFAYDKLLLATGGTPKKLPVAESSEIVYFRTLADYKRLRLLSRQYDKFTVIGGGFIGTEVAAALRTIGNEVTMLFPEDGLCAKLFPTDLSGYLNRYYRSNGVTVQEDTKVTRISGQIGNFVIETERGDVLDSEVVVAGIGIEPNTQLAEAADLAVDNGILVDAALRTSDPNIYAAGDVANFLDYALNERRRVEHEDNAITMGKIAGRSMAGADEVYNHSPMFYSDLFDLGYEAVGRLESSLTIVPDWEEAYQKGVIYYLQDDRIRGVLLWNVWDKVEQARELIAKGNLVSPGNLVGLIGDWGRRDMTLEGTFPASDSPATW